MKIIIKILLSILIVIINADSEPLPILFNLETNQPSGTLIGSIKDKIQPPYYIVPILPENQDLFNKYLAIDLDNGLINSNSIISNTDTSIKQLKFSVLSINEGIANLIIINIVNKEQTTTTTTITTTTTTKVMINEPECFSLNSNLTQFKFNDKSNCFQITNTEPHLERLASTWYSIILIDCNGLIYLNPNSIQPFINSSNVQNSKKITNFNIRTNTDEKKSWIEIECANTKRHMFNLNLNESNLKLITIDQYNTRSDYFNYFSYLERNFKILILIENKYDNNCSNEAINETISIYSEILLNSTEITTNIEDYKIQVLNYNIKICLIILVVSIIVLLIMLYGLFVWYKRNNTNKFQNIFQIDPNNTTTTINDVNSNRMIFSSSSTANLTYKTQTSTINSKYEDDYEKTTNENYLNIVITPFSKQNNNNNVLFNYSSGYLAEMGVNMMDNLNESKSARFSSYSTQHEQHLANNNDEHFQMWASMMNWKPDFNDISCVLNDLALLNDLK